MSRLINKARDFAFNAHNAIGQRRKTGEPYTVHLEEVAGIVQRVASDEKMIAAAYLHDVVEDTPCTIGEVAEHFGAEVAYLVLYLTDVSRPKDGNRATRKAIDRAHIAKGDARVHTIKLADLISNARTIHQLDASFAAVYMAEKRELIEVLGDGHPELLAEAREIVDRWYEGD